MMIDTSEYNQKENQMEYETTKGVMYAYYARTQFPVCHETGSPILAGERFLLMDGMFYSFPSIAYQKNEAHAVLHEW